MTAQKKHSGRGFSLIEILVVISILAVLAMVILTVHSSAIRSGHSVGCASNLRNIYQATLNFIYDYNGKLPPPLGPVTEVDEAFSFRAYWWGQAYVGKYAVGPMNRLPDSRGTFAQSEVEVFNCPARFDDGPDIDYAHVNGNPAISYVMAHVPYVTERFLFSNMKDPSKTLFLADGRHHVVRLVTAYSGEIGSRVSNRRYRRFHDGSMNLLFYDGRIESFSGEDRDTHTYLPELN